MAEGNGQAAGNGRDERGRFMRGNGAGRGNPFARQQAAMRQVLLEAVSEDDLKVICAKLVEKAREGDVAAARLVLAYVVGRPQPAEDPDRMDAKEWRQRVENTVREGEFEAVTQGMTVQTGNLLGDVITPGMQEEAIRQIRKGLVEKPEERVVGVEEAEVQEPADGREKGVGDEEVQKVLRLIRAGQEEARAAANPGVRDRAMGDGEDGDAVDNGV